MTKTFFPRDWFARWGLLITALIAAFAICLTALISYRTSGEFAEVSGFGQAETYLRSLRRIVEFPYPKKESLVEFLSDNEDIGLKHIAFYDGSGGSLVQAGKQSSDFGPPPFDPRQRTMERAGDRFRFTSRVPQRFGRRMMEEMMHMGPRPDATESGAEFLVLEFEPPFAKRHKLRSLLALVSALFASGFLITSAIIFSRMNKRALEAEKKLVDQRRLASLGEMSAVLAHEIRNPLGVLKGHAQLLEECLPEGSDEKKRATVVVGETVRLQTLVNELLDFVKSDRLDPVLCDPLALASEVAESVDPETVEILGAQAPGLWPLDASKLRQSLINIVQNAVQASPHGEKVILGVYAEGGNLVFRVEDRGAGIPDGDMGKIFEPFHTGRTRGVGLGLAVAKRIAEAHGGTLVAENAKGGGAIFRLTIPRRD